MLIIINDPTGATGWRRIQWDCSQTIQQNIERHMESGEGCLVRLNGVPIDPRLDPAMDMVPLQDDELLVIKRPEGAVFFWIFVAAVVVTTAVVVMALTPKIKPNITATGGGVKDSPNNKLTAQSNVARAYQGIPDVYGSRRVWPDLIQPSIVEYINHIKYVTELLCISRGLGTVSDIRYSDSVLISSEAKGASYEIFSPNNGMGTYAEDSTTVVPDVIESFAIPDVDGQEIPYSNPFTNALYPNGTGQSHLPADGRLTIQINDRSLNPTAYDQLFAIAQLRTGEVFTITKNYTGGQYPLLLNAADRVVTTTARLIAAETVTPGALILNFDQATWAIDNRDNGSISINIAYGGDMPTTYAGAFTTAVDADMLRWNVVFLRGLKGSAQVRVRLWKVTPQGETIPGTIQTIDRNYSDDTHDSRYFTETITPSAGHGRYRVVFYRTNTENSDGTNVAKVESLASLQKYATKTFPGVTLIRITTKATDTATSFRDRKINLRWQRQVRGFGSTSVSSSKNFARALIHLWSIAGRDLKQIDTAALAAINAKYGETSPLLEFNGTFDDVDMSLGERVRLIADHARCLVWHDGRKWTFTREEKRPYPVMQLDYLNMAPGEINASYSAHLPSTHDGVVVEYVDPLEQSRKAYARLDISSGVLVAGQSANPLKIRLQGCTSVVQAENRAKLDARRLLYQRQGLKFQALSDAIDLGPGSLIRWIDPDDFYADDKLQAGEVLAITENLVQTSEPLRWDGHEQGRILFTNAQGRYIGLPILCQPTAGGVRLASVPTGLYTATGTQQLGSRYVFATGLTEAEMESASLWMVTEIKPNADYSVSVSCINYDERIYSDDA